MKSFVCFALFIVVASVASATTVGSLKSSVSSDTKKDVETELKPTHTSQLGNEYNRFRKSASYGSYSAASIPAPPCPKNYLFSCQPNLAPVPCSVPGPAYGSAGAYSAPVPTYVAPMGNNYGVPQGYGGFAPQTFNQYYQY